MISKKSTSVFLCFSLLNLGLASGAWANVAPSPEKTLLTQSVLLEGQKLSSEQEESRLGALLSQYAATAPQAGRTQRLLQAIVDLQMVSLAQASAIAANAQEIAAAGKTEGADMGIMLDQLLNAPAAGAQFSGCALGGGILAGVSGFVLLLGYTLSGIADGGGTTGINRTEIIGGAGMAGAATLIVLGIGGQC